MPFRTAAGEFDWYALGSLGELTQDGADPAIAAYYTGVETAGMWRALKQAASWGNWYGSWTARALLAVNPAYVRTTLTDFQLYVSGTCLPAAWYTRAQSTGNDVVFTDLANNKLPHALTHFNKSGAAMEGHVRVTLTPSAGPMLLWAYTGNAAASDQRQTASTFAGHIARWDLGQASGNLLDSTDTWPGTPTDVSQGTTGALYSAGGAGFNGSTSRVYLGNTIGGAHSGHTGATISCWYKRAATGTQMRVYQSLSGPSAVRLLLRFLSNDTLNISACARFDETTLELTTSGAYTDTASWHHVAGVVDVANQQMHLYHDGQVAAAGDAPFTIGAFDAAAYIGFIGRHASSSTYWYNGLLDEVRLRPVALSADYIAAEYANQANPTAFVKCLALQLR